MKEITDKLDSILFKLLLCTNTPSREQDEP